MLQGVGGQIFISMTVKHMKNVPMCKKKTKKPKPKKWKRNEAEENKTLVSQSLEDKS